MAVCTPALQAKSGLQPRAMLTEGNSNWSGRENLHSVKSYGHPLGVTCADCGHRATVPLHKRGHLDGNMASIKSLKLVCQAYGSKNWKATFFARQHEVETFTAG